MGTTQEEHLQRELKSLEDSRVKDKQRAEERERTFREEIADLEAQVKVTRKEIAARQAVVEFSQEQVEILKKDLAQARSNQRALAELEAELDKARAVAQRLIVSCLATIPTSPISPIFDVEKVTQHSHEAITRLLDEAGIDLVLGDVQYILEKPYPKDEWGTITREVIDKDKPVPTSWKGTRLDPTWKGDERPPDHRSA